MRLRFMMPLASLSFCECVLLSHVRQIGTDPTDPEFHDAQLRLLYSWCLQGADLRRRRHHRAAELFEEDLQVQLLQANSTQICNDICKPG